MTVEILDYFQMKPEFLGPHFASRAMYVRPGELALYADPNQWEHLGRTCHPTSAQAAEVERRGYCDRPLRTGPDWKKIAKTWYGRAPA